MEDILKALSEGRISLEEARRELEDRLYSDSGTNPDVGREGRTGIPEVIISDCKSLAQVWEITRKFLERGGRAMISRLDGEWAKDVSDRIKAGFPGSEVIYDETAGFLVARSVDFELPKTGGRVGFITAGTSDISVSREGEIIAREMGCETKSLHDIGVAGVHRLFRPLREMKDWGADALVVAAGREGALPTLVSGLVAIPVIGLPVSTGYGIHGKGEAALFAMLQSCSPLAVVNIDAGFVAGAVAARIARNSWAQRC